MMRFIRQLIGTSRREAEVNEMLRSHQEVFQKGERQVRAKVLVIERLVQDLQKDVTTWR